MSLSFDESGLMSQAAADASLNWIVHIGRELERSKFAARDHAKRLALGLSTRLTAA
jgi:hypothetical protein